MHVVGANQIYGSLRPTGSKLMIHVTDEKPSFAALLAQQAGRQSHNLKVMSSSLTQGSLLF